MIIIIIMYVLLYYYSEAVNSKTLKQAHRMNSIRSAGCVRVCVGIRRKYIVFREREYVCFYEF